MIKNTSFVTMIAREIADILVDAKNMGLESMTVGDVMRALDMKESLCSKYDDQVLDLTVPFTKNPLEIAEKLYSTVH